MTSVESHPTEEYSIKAGFGLPVTLRLKREQSLGNR
jgi:hypothetical protein